MKKIKHPPGETAQLPNRDREPGWAIEMGFEAACDLGRRFQQDAIFWVSGNRVRVAKCASDLQSAAGGPFSDRFEIEEKLR
jgi:hypothetical protein